jgi:hypothetical protein
MVAPEITQEQVLAFQRQQQQQQQQQQRNGGAVARQ